MYVLTYVASPISPTLFTITEFITYVYVYIYTILTIPLSISMSMQIYCGSAYTIARMRCEDDSAYAAWLLNSSPPCLPELL